MPDTGITLVTGATGNTGSGVAAALLARGRRVRALVRDEGKAAGLREQGAELAVADLERPETLPDDLLEGVTDVYFCVWNGPHAHAHARALLDAIERSGTRPRIVRLSAFGDPRSRIVAEVEKGDEDIKASGLRWTLIKPTFFLQNLMMVAPTVKEHGVIYFDWGDGKAGMTDVRDIVDCAVALLSGDAGDTHGETFVLTGPASVGFADVAAALSDVTGRSIEYVPVPHEAATEAMMAMGVPEWIARGYAELSAGFEEGFADTTTDNVRRLAGHAPRSLEQFARDYADVFAGSPAHA